MVAKAGRCDHLRSVAYVEKLVKMKDSIFSELFLPRFVFNVNCVGKDDTGHLFKSPSKYISSIWVLVENEVKGCAQVVNKSVIIDGWMFV